MKKVKNTLILSFYFTLVLVLSVQVVETVFAGSILISKSRTVQQLTAQKSQLEEKNSQLQLQYTAATSLASISQTDKLDGYTQIVNPIIVEVPTTVAQR